MSNYKKILFTGSTGRFGALFKSFFDSKKYIYPTRKELDITSKKSIKKFIVKKKPDLVIHCAALSRPMDVHEKEISKSILTNIIGTANLVRECEEKNIKIIYFSTSHVYPGTKGNYSEIDNLNPINNYAWSKLGGECAVQMYKNSLILRISMTQNPFIHKQAYKNLKTNFMFHDDVIKIIPKLLKYKGVINIGGPIQSVYDFAKKFNPKIKGINLKMKKNLNISMNISKLKKILND